MKNQKFFISSLLIANALNIRKFLHLLYSGELNRNYENLILTLYEVSQDEKSKIFHKLTSYEVSQDEKSKIFHELTSYEVSQDEKSK